LDEGTSIPGGLFKAETGPFKKIIYGYYRKHGRSLPWRNTDNPYHILISEIMLQQTQVERVINKYDLFLTQFPDLMTLAKAPLTEVLRAWQGLGYNRRALSLARSAQIILSEYEGTLPANMNELAKLPGIGQATAGSILAFAFNKPSIFIETNIRRVFIHHFFAGRDEIRDEEIRPLVEKTLDRSNPREWYYALMDYGSMLKKQIVNPNKRSTHYSRQSPFEDSDRKIRGAILKALLQKPSLTEQEIAVAVRVNAKRVQNILIALAREGFIIKSNKVFRIA